MTFTPTAAVAALKAYDPGHDLPALRRRFAQGALVELGSNENSFGPSPKVLDALRNADAAEIWRYPDPLGLSLRTALAKHLDVDTDEIVLGNGSHELLMLLAQCFAGPGDEVLFSEFGFAVFPIATAAVGATPRRASALATNASMPRGHDLAGMAALLSPATRLVYVANPNNPTGTWFSQMELTAFLAQVPVYIPVVVDEAYHECVTEADIGTAMDLRARFPNLVVTRTFSKGYGLAGLRVGYAVASREVIGLINRLRESFNVNALALIAAQAALSDQAYLRQVRDAVAGERERVAKRLREHGYIVYPSQTNFLLLDFGKPAGEIEAALLAQGVVVRPMRGYGLPTCLRVTVATAGENDALLKALGA